MVVALAAALGLVQQSGYAAGRYELAERLKRLDVAWMATKDPARRKSAIDLINTATTSFFTSRMSEAAMALDEAISKLENRRHRPSDALAVRPERPFCEPGATVSLKITWAYRPASVLPVEVGVGRQTVSVRPGSDATLNVNPWVANPELRQNQEIGFLMPVSVGSETRFVYLSFVRKVDERLARLVGSQDPFVSEIGRALDRFQSKPETLETELPLVSYLFSAEAVEDGKAKVGELEQVYLAKQGDTTLRAAFPKGRPNGPIDVVIAVHGSGGSENMFFEAMGRGMAASEALRRGWAIVAPRARQGCVDDCIDWLVKVRGIQIRRLFLLGHSMGGGIVLSGMPKIKPAAIAALAPGTSRISPALDGIPIYVAVGASDPLGAMVRGLVRANEDRPGFKFEAFDPCEHTMIGADSLPSVYRFFDSATSGS